MNEHQDNTSRPAPDEDRALLEAAARAAGIEIQIMALSGPNIIRGPLAGKRWNPLTDDGDALRLSVKLSIVPRHINGVAFAWRDGVCDMQEPCGTDPYAATRRAIVRAAAA